MQEQLQNHIRNSIAAQITTVLTSYADDLEGTPLKFDLEMARQSLSGTAVAASSIAAAVATAVAEAGDAEAEGPTLPVGFASEQEFEDFLDDQEEQLPTMINDEGEEFLVRPDDVVGVVEQADGTFVNVGSMEESLAKVEAVIEESNTIRDEDTGEELFQTEAETVDTIRVKFTREDGQPLTAANVKTILADRVAQPMVAAFGTSYNLVAGETDASKVAHFEIPENGYGQRVSKGLTHASNIMRFGGQVPIIGVGIVTAALVD